MNDLNLKSFEYTSILGWSVSRYDKFTSCKRQYFYDYYAKYDKEYPRYKIDKLKDLTSIPLEKGNIVHEVLRTFLSRLLKSEDNIDISRFLDFAKRKAEDQCHTKKFAEIYYKETDAIDESAIVNGVNECLNAFLTSDRYNWLVKEAVLEKTNWIIDPPGYGETRLNGMKAYCKVDFLFPVKDSIYIIDWKTGKKDDKHKKQLLGYVSWAAYHFNKNPTDVIPIIAYLHAKYEELKISFNEYDIEEFIKQVAEETDEMYSMCVNPEENIPKPKEEFVKTGNKIICKFCNYKEICG
jgi:hypothetical protein